MENASKALIVAGAILLAIVIISLGLIVINNSREPIDNADMSEQQIQTFNAKFTSFEGPNKSGSQVNTLIQNVIASNQANFEAGKTEQLICIGIPNRDADASTNPTKWIGINTSTGVMAAKTNNKDKADNVNSGDASTSNSYVETGKTYNVKITQYKKGFVQSIYVTAE